MNKVYKIKLRHQDIRESEIYRMKGQSLRDIFIVLLMLHTMVSGKAFSFFRCQEVEGTPYLMVDYRVVCHDSAWWSMFVFVALVILLFSFGVPAAVAYTLYQNREELNDPEIKRLFGILYK